jgi:hypothetical protein
MPAVLNKVLGDSVTKNLYSTNFFIHSAPDSPIYGISGVHERSLDEAREAPENTS